MSYHRIPLLAGVAFRVGVAGVLVLVDDIGAASGLDISLVRNSQPQVTIPNRKAAFRHVGRFEDVILTTDVDATVGIFLSNEDVQLGVIDGSAVSVPAGLVVTNTVLEPIPVNFTGTVEPVFGVATIDNNDAEAIPMKQQVGAIFRMQKEALAVLSHNAAVVINTGAAQALVSDATLKRLRVKNASATQRVAIGGVGVTMANAAIILEPGDTWLEEDAPGAAWYATSDVAGADVRVMGVK